MNAAVQTQEDVVLSYENDVEYVFIQDPDLLYVGGGNTGMLF